jgi:hypothetical protein
MASDFDPHVKYQRGQRLINALHGYVSRFQPVCNFSPIVILPIKSKIELVPVHHMIEPVGSLLVIQGRLTTGKVQQPPHNALLDEHILNHKIVQTIGSQLVGATYPVIGGVVAHVLLIGQGVKPVNKRIEHLVRRGIIVWSANFQSQHIP